MKYRVIFKCYHYNTGNADNGYYNDHEDFDTIQEAKQFKVRVEKQIDICSKRIIYPHTSSPPTEYELKYNKIISLEDFENWKNSDEPIEIEDGFIAGPVKIVKYYPERIEEL